MTTIRVNTAPGYDILIARGLLRVCGETIAATLKGRKALIISDSTVAPLYAERVLASLQDAGIEASLYVFEAGEEHKQLSTVAGMLGAMCEAGLSRADFAVALGGGVTGDMAGFAAAMYLRGIPFVQIPTTLLSQVDSSVGGKTGCDLPQGKNLAGAFYNPALVLIDPDTLHTLPARFMRDGMAEVIKTALIRDAALFRRLREEDPSTFLETIIETCVKIKRDVVERDFKERGERMLLNFGHTLGHAIEAYHHFSGPSHGEAVAAGWAMISAAAARRGLTPKGITEQITDCLTKNGLPTGTDVPLESLLPYLVRDKKRHGDKMHLVLLRDIGDGYVYDLPASDLPAFLEGVQ